jgi:hypothetical protein
MGTFRTLLIAAAGLLLSGCATGPYVPPTPEQAEYQRKLWICFAYVDTFQVIYPSEQYAYENLCRADPDRALAMKPPPPPY